VRFHFGPFTLDLDSRQLTNAGEEIHLEPKAFELLSALVLERPKALSKADLQERLWPGTFVAEANLSNLVAEIRAALGDPARAPKFVRTAHGFGYAFCGEAVPLLDPDAPPVREASDSSDAIRGAAHAVSPPTRESRVPWLVAGVLAVGLIATTVIALRTDGGRTSGTSPAQFAIAPPEHASFGGPSRGGSGTATQLAVSPDGRHIVFVARAAAGYQIWLRPVATLEATPIQGTEGGVFPFWSPDSRSIGFFANGKLKIVQIIGGPAVVLADAPGAGGGSWSRDNVILFAPGPSQIGLLRVSSAGGVPTVATTLDKTTGEDSTAGLTFCPMAGTFSTLPSPDPAVRRPHRR
jgi:DNA-binding winged helix-turn-helix (wHTH) protein